MKNLVEAIRRNTEPQERLRRAQQESDFSAFRRKFAMAFASRRPPSGAEATPDGDSPPQEKPEQVKRNASKASPGNARRAGNGNHGARRK